MTFSLKRVIVIYLLLLNFFFFLTPSLALAQSSSSVGLLPGIIPGQDCGVASGKPPLNRCCLPNTGKIKSSSGIPGAFQIVMDAISGFINALASPFIDSFNGQIKTNSVSCLEGVQSATDSADPNCLCIKKAATSDEMAASLCNPISTERERKQCIDCMTNKGGINCVWTAVGPVSTNVSTFIQETMLSWGIGLAGGISMLCIIYSAFQMQTSGGNAEKVKKAQQLLTSCITGLMLILFSVLILKIIGVDILRIPGFG